MLVLARRPLQDVIIFLPDGREVVVSVAEICRDKVRLGFDAPRDVRIDRREIAERERLKST